jgi:ketosteroid isomerase-like protein
MLGSSAKEGPAMNRLFSVLFLSSLVLVFGPTRTSSQSTSDEETLKKLEIEGASHSGTSDADIAFEKKVNSEHVVTVDPLGHVSDQTPGDVEKMSLGVRKADPYIKTSIEIHDIKVRISGDTAIVTYSGTYNATGHKDARYDVPNAKFVAVDTWQKRSGQWKILAQAFVATDPIPSDVYKLPPPPGVQ